MDIHWRISPRYRVNDKISLSYVLSIRNKYNDIGFVTNDTSVYLYILHKLIIYLLKEILT